MIKRIKNYLKHVDKFSHSIGLLISLCFFLTITSFSPIFLDANSEQVTLLRDRFGVNLSLLPPHDGMPYHSFNLSSLNPTKNLDSVQWTDSLDWYGNWSVDNWETSTVWGTPPYGGEWYDIEAIYFDINMTHIFIGIITSTPFYREWEGIWDVGVQEPRWDMDNNWVRPGDLCFDFHLGNPRLEKLRVWSYDYGIDLIHDNRDHKYFPIWGNVYMRDNNLGSSLYQTVADPGGENIQDPGFGFDWYTSSWHVEGNWEHTNFDPFSINSSSSLKKIGDSSDGIIVDYYKYQFTGEWEGHQENNADTWIIEVSIPIRLFPDENWPPKNGIMGIQWLSSCRNDARTEDGSNLIVTIPGYLGDMVWEDIDVDGIQDIGEPGVPGVNVHLFNSSLDKIATTITDTSGLYGFSGLIPGSYYLKFDLPSGYIFSLKNTTDEKNDSNADRTSGMTDRIDLSPGQFDLSRDAGLFQYAYMGDMVWEDIDVDGIQDIGEPGVPGVNVHLFNSSLDKIATTITDTSGLYGFSGLIPGSYYLKFDLPSGYIFSLKNTTDEKNDSNADRTSGMTDRIDLSPGQFDFSQDAGVYIKKENYSPLKPTIVGPKTGQKNMIYEFTVSTYDTDNDNIQYLFNWGDGETYRTGFLKSGASSIQKHRWLNYGEYFISIIASDTQDATSVINHTILIDVVKIEDLIKGYLVDENSDGTYDSFINKETGEMTFLGIENSTYLIDSDGDAIWDHIYDLEVGISTYYHYLYQKYYKKIQTDFQETPGFGIITIVSVMAITTIMLKRKKQQKKSH